MSMANPSNNDGHGHDGDGDSDSVMLMKTALTMDGDYAAYDGAGEDNDNNGTR